MVKRSAKLNSITVYAITAVMAFMQQASQPAYYVLLQYIFIH